MVLYHFAYNLNDTFGVKIPLFDSAVMNFFRDVFAGGFILICGISCRLSRNNLKRGSICLFVATLITISTAVFTPQMIIVFGILHFMGCAILSYVFLSKYLSGKFSFATPLLFAAFLLTQNISDGYIGLFSHRFLPLPNILYQSNILAPLGFFSESFYSSDYFPIFPWIFIFYIGVHFGVPLSLGDAPRPLYRSYMPILGAVGRYTLIIYLLHQPIIFALMLMLRS